MTLHKEGFWGYIPSAVHISIHRESPAMKDYVFTVFCMHMSAKEPERAQESLRAFSLILVSANERRKILDSNDWEKLPEWSVWCLIFWGYNTFKLIYPHKIKDQHPSQLVTYPWGLILIQTFWCSIQTLKCQADSGRCFTACFTLPCRGRQSCYMSSQEG